MKTQKNIALGITLILISCVLLWCCTFFHDSLSQFSYIDRDLLLITLWLCPAVASFLVYFQHAKARLLISIGYIVLLSGGMSLTHFILGEMGANVDFPGIEGLRVTMWFYTFFSMISISAGGIAGFLCRKAKN